MYWPCEYTAVFLAFFLYSVSSFLLHYTDLDK